jgi:hypothetical protein
MSARWALVVEIASWFIGVGEIKAALRAFRGVREVSEAAKVLRLLSEAGDVADSARNLARAQELLRLMAKGTDEEEMVRLLRALGEAPPEDARRIAQALSETDPARLREFEEFAKLHPELAERIGTLVERERIFQVLEAKHGGAIPPALRDSLHRVADAGALNADELATVLNQLSPADGESWLKLAEALPDAALRAPNPAARGAALKAIASDGRLVTLMTRHGDAALVEKLIELGGRDLRRAGDLTRACGLLERRALLRGEPVGEVLADVKGIGRLDEATESASALRLADEAAMLTRGHTDEVAGLVYDALSASSPQRFENAIAALRKRLAAEGAPADLVDDLESEVRLAGSFIERPMTGVNLGLDSQELLKQQARARVRERPGNRDAQEYLAEVAKLPGWEKRLADESNEFAKVVNESNEVLATIPARDGNPARTITLKTIAEEGGDEALRRQWVMYKGYLKRKAREGEVPSIKSFAQYYRQVSTKYARGYLGETELGFWLGRTHVLLKAPHANHFFPGRDVVAIERVAARPDLRRRLFFLDNKNFAGGGQINDVGALTRNFVRNVESDMDDILRLANQSDAPEAMREAAERLRRVRPQLDAEVARARQAVIDRQAASGRPPLSTRDLDRATREALDQNRIDDILRSEDIYRVTTGAGGTADITLHDDLRNIGLLVGEIEHADAPLIPVPDLPE